MAAEWGLSAGVQASLEAGRVPRKVTVREWLRVLVMEMAFPSLFLWVMERVKEKACRWVMERVKEKVCRWVMGAAEVSPTDQK